MDNNTKLEDKLVKDQVTPHTLL